MDGWGYSPVHEGNAIWAAKTPTYDELWKNYSHLLLNAFGENVGLPWGSIGSSEVGHTAIGSGKLIFQELSLIDKEIVDKSFYKNSNLVNYFSKAKKQGDIHLIGLISNGGVHSHIQHLYSLLAMAKKQGFKKNVFIHMITDGRDTSPKSALQFVDDLNRFLKRQKITAKIVTIAGRYYSMDRDNRWDRTKKSFVAMTKGEGQVYASAEEAIKASYDKNITDEFIEPAIISNEQITKESFWSKFFGKKIEAPKEGNSGNIKPRDNLIFFNTRPDRMRQLVEIFLFKKNELGTTPPEKLNVMTLSTYNEFLPVAVAYPTKKIDSPLAKILSDNKFTQGHFAETEKYVHVTYFFNGGNSKPFPGEKWILVPSQKVATYDKKPQMSASEITSSVLKTLEKDKLDFVLINYANADMVGHTGDFKAAIIAIETIDQQLKRLREALPDSTLIITADHGNAECMIHPETGEIDKHHTVNPVPFIIVDDKFKASSENNSGSEPAGILADIAPTVLYFYGLKKSPEMNGVSLIKNLSENVDKK